MLRQRTSTMCGSAGCGQLLRPRPTSFRCRPVRLDSSRIGRSLATLPPAKDDDSARRTQQAAPASVDAGTTAAAAATGEEPKDADDPGLMEVLRTLDPLTRKQLSVLAVGTGVVSLGFGMVVPVLPMFAAQWGDMGATGIGMVVAAPTLSKLLLNRYAGRRADSHGRVHMMVGGAALSSCGNFLTALATSMSGVCGARLVVGAGGSAGGAASQAYLADVTAKFPQHRGAIMGTLGSIGMLSYGLGPAAGGLLAEQFGPSISFGCVGVAAAICAGAYSRLPETLPKATQEAAQRGETVEGEKAVEIGFLELLQSNPRLQQVIVMDSAVYIGWAVWMAVVPLQAVAVWQATPGTLGTMYSVMAIAGAIGAPLGGVLSDKIGRDKTIGANCNINANLFLNFLLKMQK